jgi:uncharacterized protein with NAD-binding domain and iron-sulfur cluster
MLLVGLFAPGEQCSAAAALGMLYYFILAHQPDFDVVWCRGTVGEKIFRPWVEQIEKSGGKVFTHQRVTDLRVEDTGEMTGAVTGVVCGDEVFETDAVIFAVGVSGMQKIVSSSPTLRQHQAFRNLMNLGAIDVLATRLWFDRKVNIPLPSNACFGFDPTTGWTFFDLNALHDEYRDFPGSVVEADFYHANQLLPMSDPQVIAKVHHDLATCLPEFRSATVTDSSVIRLSKAVTHFSPGSYPSMMTGTTPIANVFMSGDWVVTRHGSWSQEKAYVTGLEAANQVIQHFNQGTPANILPVQADEPHIQLARSLNHTLRNWGETFLPNFWLP